MRRFLRGVFIIILFIVLVLTQSFSTNNNHCIKFADNPGTLMHDTVPSLDGMNYFVSNKGSDSNDGRSASSPKLRISSIEKLISNSTSGANGISLNLDGNSLFREEYDPVQGNMQVRSFGLASGKQLAKITGMDVVSDWSPTPGTTNVYQHLLQHSIDLSSPAYNYIMVAEIDTALEKTYPVTAVKYLALVTTLEQCKSLAATYYTPDLTSNTAMVYIHPAEGSPGKNKFRYEVATRNYNINAYNIDNSIYENLFLQTSGNGYGMLSAGKNTLIKNVVFQGGGTHHTVIKSGQIDSCLFLPGPKGLKDRIAAVFYNAEGTGDNNKITNTVFLDIQNPVYTHTYGVISHKSLLLDNVFAFADSTDAATALSGNDTDSTDISNCYVEGYPTGWYGGSTKLNIKSSIFKNTDQSAIMLFAKQDLAGSAKISNSVIKTNGNDNNQNLANGWTAYGIRSPYNNMSVEANNNIFHCFSTWHGPYQTVTTFQINGPVKAHYNIYICDVNDINTVNMYQADNSGGIGTSSNVSSDYNAYILLRGAHFQWVVSPNYTVDRNVFSLPEWQTLTGQDKHSIVLDLRNNPLGLKAVFVDPQNGNWTLAQTVQADSIRSISAGMTTPSLFYPKRPSIENSGAPFKTPGGFSSFKGTTKSETESIVQWQTFNEYDFSYFNIEYSLDGTNFLDAGSLKAINDGKNNNYQYVHTHEATDSIFYRLSCLLTDSSKLVSSVIRLYTDFSQEFKIIIYPNPFQQTITVAHPRRNAGEIRIYDYEGRLLKIAAVLARSSSTMVSLSNLPAGRYFVQWTSNQEKLSGTVVK